MRGHFRGHFNFDLNTAIEMSFVEFFCAEHLKNDPKQEDAIMKKKYEAANAVYQLILKLIK